MIETIRSNLFRMEIPLPNNPLQFVNSYVIKGPKRNLIIDTGMNRTECAEAMQLGLRELGADVEETDFFITHMHADHLGLALRLNLNHSQVYFNRLDEDWIRRIRSGELWEDLINFTRENGFPENELEKVRQNHPGYQLGGGEAIAFVFLKDGDSIGIGDYLFQCVQTPGHTTGHMCLHEQNLRILVSGDHILSGITPIIQLRSDKENPLRDYFASLDKVCRLDVDLVLPGHRGVFRNCKERIEELKLHHQKRSDEVCSILRKGAQNAYQIASQMTWDIPESSWDQYPVMQKWFAIGEAIAHLKYLEEKGMVRKELRDKARTYMLHPSF